MDPHRRIDLLHMEIVNKHPFEFYGDQLLMHLTDQNQILLPSSDLCEVIGLNVSAETRRIRRAVAKRCVSHNQRVSSI